MPGATYNAQKNASIIYLGLVDINYCKTLSTAEVHYAFPSGQFINDHCILKYWTASSPHIGER